MSQEKDDKSKPSTAQGTTGSDKPGDPAKRPYATLDLKATEVKGGEKAAAGSAVAAAASTWNNKADANGKPQAATPSPSQLSAGTAKTATPDAPASLPPKATAKPAESKPAAAAPSTASVWLPSLVSGAAGAILAMLGLGSMGLIGGDTTSGTLADRLAALETAVRTQPSADVAKQVAAANSRLATIEAENKTLADSQAALTADAKALDAKLANQTPSAAAAAERIQKLEQQLADLSAAAATDPQRGRIPALAQITTKLGDLDTQLTTRTSGLKAEMSQEMEKRLAKADETAEAARARLAQRTQSLEQTVKSVADDTTSLRAAVDGLKGDLETRFKAAAKPADVAAAVEPVTTKIAGLEKNLAGVVRSEKDRNATAGNILLSIELGNLKRAIDRGGKYASELASVKKVGGDKLNLTVLESAQASGVPSLATLGTEFRELAYKMLDAEAEPEQGGVVDRLLADPRVTMTPSPWA